MRAWADDLKYAWRILLKKPGFVTIVVLTLALGIGANTAVYSVVMNTILTATPYHEPDRLVYFRSCETRREDGADIGTSVAEYFDWRASCECYEDIGIHFSFGYNLTGGDHPERVQVTHATASLAPLLGVDAALGRLFNAEEDKPGAPYVALLSDGFWRRYFGGDPDVIGRTVELESTPYTVIGILPRVMDREWAAFDLWTPLRADPEKANRGGVGWTPIARLKSSVSLAQAQAEMDGVSAHLAQLYPDLNQHTVRVRPFEELRFRGRDVTATWILAAAAGFVLLIACANAATLMLVRATDRRGEFALRAALGADGRRLVRQTLIESMLLALGGGALGVLLATWGVDLAAAVLSEQMAGYDMRVDAKMLAFTAAACLITALLFGAAPAFFGARVDLCESLKHGTATSMGRRPARHGRDLLLTGQIATAFVTATFACLLTQSFTSLSNSDPGFDVDRLLTLEVSVDRKKYTGNYMKRVQFFDAALDNVRNAPGIESAAAAYHAPLINRESSNGVVVEDFVGPTGSGEIMVNNLIVTPGYFETLGVPLIQGRYFTEDDVYGAPEALIVSRRAAEHFWPGEDPIGKRIRFGWSDGDQPWIPVVGVVGDVSQRGLDRERPIQVYRTLAQGGSYTSHLTIVARTQGDPLASAKALQRAVWDVDPDQPAFQARSMRDIIDFNTRESKALATLVNAFAAIAAVLVATGLYGVISHMATQRKREIGLRMALGARSTQAATLILKKGLGLTCAGIAIGVGLAAAGAHLLTGVLYKTNAFDPAAYLVAAGALAAVTLTACYIPARRAARIDPMTALRCE